jgi:hypothetical protein
MFLVFQFYLVLVKGLGRHFESKLHKYIGCFRLIVLELGIFCMFMIICCFYYYFFIQVCLVMIMWVAEAKRV